MTCHLTTTTQPATPCARSPYAMHFARAIAAAPGQLLRAWTDPDLLIEWWGPHWFVDTGTDGERTTTVFRHTDHPARIGIERVNEPRFRAILVLETSSAETTDLSLRLEFGSRRAWLRERHYMSAAIDQHLDRLEAFVARAGCGTGCVPVGMTA